MAMIGDTRAVRGRSLPVSILILIGFAAVGMAARLCAQNAHSQVSADANQLAREVIQNEIQAQVRDDSLWEFQEQKEEGGKIRTFHVCQTKEGEINRLVALNNEPLSPKQEQAENQRIQRLLKHPQQFREEEKKRHEDADQERNLLKTFPDAFRFQYVDKDGALIKLKFTPNPKFHPSGHPEQVFHHMEGTLLVDGEQKRLAEINGQLITEVKFLGGLLGHLDKGGTFCVKQHDFGSGHWEMTFMNVQMDGRALFFKTIAVREKEAYSDFKPVPASTTLQMAVDLLKKTTRTRISASNSESGRLVP
jgi:hypothetical protein